MFRKSSRHPFGCQLVVWCRIALALALPPGRDRAYWWSHSLLLMYVSCRSATEIVKLLHQKHICFTLPSLGAQPVQRVKMSFQRSAWLFWYCWLGLHSAKLGEIIVELCSVRLRWMRSFKSNALLLMLFLGVEAFLGVPCVVITSETTYKIHTSVALLSRCLLMFVRSVQGACSHGFLLVSSVTDKRNIWSASSLWTVSSCRSVGSV